MRLDYGRDDLEARLELSRVKTGLAAGIPGRDAVVIGDRPLYLLHWNSSESNLTRSSISEYFQRHPEFAAAAITELRRTSLVESVQRDRLH